MGACINRPGSPGSIIERPIIINIIVAFVRQNQIMAVLFETILSPSTKKISQLNQMVGPRAWKLISSEMRLSLITIPKGPHPRRPEMSCLML